MTGINHNVEGKQTRIVAQSSGSVRTGVSGAVRAVAKGGHRQMRLS
jgi:hypothetical protein